jgi:hypothetical protein
MAFSAIAVSLFGTENQQQARLLQLGCHEPQVAKSGERKIRSPRLPLVSWPVVFHT